MLWGADARQLFYMKMDAEHRPHEAWMHTIQTKSKTSQNTLGNTLEKTEKEPDTGDVLLLREDDQLFWMGLGKTASDRFLVISVDR